jgi:N-acetylmuramoyl-L-alanine amidase
MGKFERSLRQWACVRTCRFSHKPRKICRTWWQISVFFNRNCLKTEVFKQPYFIRQALRVARERRTQFCLNLILTLFLIFLPTGAFGAEGRALVTFLDESGIDLSWEPYLETGRLSRGAQSAAFRLGDPWLVMDRTKKVPCEPLLKDKGTLLIPASTEKLLHDYFFPPISRGPRVAAIFIDPGHGGKDPGTIGRHTFNGKSVVLNEKDIVLDTALMLGDMLRKAFPDKKVVFSRTRDTYYSPEERPEMAHAVKIRDEDAIIFVSIHVNASINPKGKGYEVWYLPPGYRRNLMEGGEDGVEYQSILNHMKEETFSRESIMLAQHILKGFDTVIGPLSESRGIKEESWIVVRKAKMPAVLVEIGFVTNPEEAKLLADRAHLRKIAQAIYNGIAAFVREFDEKNK